MKTSILIPSLDADYLNDLMPQITGPDREIVVCSPYEPPAPCVWVKDTELAGNNPANRMAFEASTGDVIVCMCDDITIASGWLEEGLCRLETGDLIVSLAPLETSLCFDLLYANLPMCRRETVKKYWRWFYPYRAHWGDPAFSMSVWEGGGKVVATKPLVAFRNRSGHPPVTLTWEAFGADCKAFLEDFPNLCDKWLIENWRLFNHAEPKI
jgi:glycosyltransferase involved in cell wall biosynthesis